MAVYMELAAGDTLMIGATRIRLERKSGQRARLLIDSSEDIDRVKAGEPVPAARVTTPRPAGSPQPFLQRPPSAAK